MTYATAEVRWFWRGEVPQAVLDWLSGWRVPPEVQTVRVDDYARLPAGMRDTVGVKLREGRLEVKWRHEDRGPVRVATGAFGRLELWRKQIFAQAETGASPVARLATAGEVIAVGKGRRLARFSTAEDGTVAAVESVDAQAGDAPTGSAPTGACEFEVTAVRALGQVWWTVCFEAFGSDDAMLEATLLRVAGHVLAAPHPLALDAAHSLSYPQWLAHIEGAL